MRVHTTRTLPIKRNRETHGPNEAFLRYINAYCDWARDPGVKRSRHISGDRLRFKTQPKSHEIHHANFWNSFIDPMTQRSLSHQYVEFESVSPFDSKFPTIMEIRTRRYWDVESLCMKKMRVDKRKEHALDLHAYCHINRDRGMPERHSNPKRHHDPPNTPSYLDPFDDSFGSPTNRSGIHVKLIPRLETVYESVNPFDERFPALELVALNSDPHITKKRRQHLTHQEKRSRLIKKKMREYARETVIRKRQLRKAFRAIPEGLRFPSPGYKTTFISVSPFDDSFPNGARAKASSKKKVQPHTRGATRPVVAPMKLIEITINAPFRTSEPFPALTPIAAKAFAKRGFFGDLSPRQAGGTALLPEAISSRNTTGLTHGLH